MTFTPEQIIILENHRPLLEKAITKPGSFHLTQAQKQTLGSIYLTFSPNDCITGCGNQWLTRLANWYFKTLEDKSYIIK